MQSSSSKACSESVTRPAEGLEGLRRGPAATLLQKDYALSDTRSFTASDSTMPVCPGDLLLRADSAQKQRPWKTASQVARAPRCPRSSRALSALSPSAGSCQCPGQRGTVPPLSPSRSSFILRASLVSKCGDRRRTIVALADAHAAFLRQKNSGIGVRDLQSRANEEAVESRYVGNLLQRHAASFGLKEEASNGDRVEKAAEEAQFQEEAEQPAWNDGSFGHPEAPLSAEWPHHSTACSTACSSEPSLPLSLPRLLQVCGRPCVRFMHGNCEQGAACQFCHLEHTRPGGFEHFPGQGLHWLQAQGEA